MQLNVSQVPSSISPLVIQLVQLKYISNIFPPRKNQAVTLRLYFPSRTLLAFKGLFTSLSSVTIFEISLYFRDHFTTDFKSDSGLLNIFFHHVPLNIPEVVILVFHHHVWYVQLLTNISNLLRQAGPVVCDLLLKYLSAQSISTLCFYPIN